MEGTLTARVAALRESTRGRSGPDFRLVRERTEGERTSILELWGSLPVGWAGNLSLHCAGAKLSIVDGEAERLGGRHWVAAFRVRETGQDPGGVDFVRMAVRRPTTALRGPEVYLRRAEVRAPREAPGEAALVTVEAEDRLGLLGFLLGKFAFFGLYPSRLSVRTRAGRARDRFWLRGVGETPPAEQPLRLVAAQLRVLCDPMPGRKRP